MKFFYDTDLKSLDKIAEDIELFCEESDVDMASAYAINLSVDEIFTNIVSYGFTEAQRACAKKVEIEIKRLEDCVYISIRDEAKPFNPLEDAPCPDLDACVEERKIGGLGIFLIKKNMDELSYRRIGNVNELTMLRKLGVRSPKGVAL